MPRREFSKKTKAAAFLRANGRCEKCGGVLRPGKFHYDHDNPDGLTGEPTLENCVVLCHPCHAEKTNKHDKPAIAKAKRREMKHVMGIKQRKAWPLAKRFKRKLDGTVVER